MKKTVSRFVFLLLVLCSCGNNSPFDINKQGGHEIVLEIDAADFLYNESHPTYRYKVKAVCDSIRNQNFENGKKFLELFCATLTKQYPELKTQMVFPDCFKDRSSKELLHALLNQYQLQIDLAENIITQRLERMGIEEGEMRVEKKQSTIVVTVDAKHNSKRLQSLLSYWQPLYFYHIYSPNEAFQFINKADSLLGKYLMLADTNTAPIDTINYTTVIEEKDPSARLLKQFKEDEKREAQKKERERKVVEKTHPFYSFISPNIYYDELDKFYYGEGHLGFLNVKDTSNFNTFIKDSIFKSQMPKDIHFMYSFKPFKDKDSLINLYAIKSNSLSQPLMKGNTIADAHAYINDNNLPGISFQLNAEGAEQWKKITKENVNKCIAIALNNEILICPKIDNEIPDGRSVINGDFTTQETEDLANIILLSSDELPVKIKSYRLIKPK